MIREFGSEFNRLNNKYDYYFRNVFESFDNILLLRSGREALSVIAEVEETGNILVPAYSCDSMIEPFRKRGWKILFYPLNKDFAPDLDFIKNITSTNYVKAVLLMNYWGGVNLNESLNLIKRLDSNIISIIDITHCIFSLKTINDRVDYYVGSIRKWMGLLDGGILVSSKKINVKVNIGSSKFVEIRKEALHNRCLYYSNLIGHSKTNCREELRNAEYILDSDMEIHSMSLNSIIQLYNTDFSSFKQKRIDNYNTLLNLLKEAGIKIAYENQIIDNIPFSIPIIVKRRNEIKKLLSEKGVYCSVLWPINEEVSSLCSVAKMMSNNMLSIPIDQRYSLFDMYEIADRIISVINKRK